MKPIKRSPLKGASLRNPGQSLDEQKLDLMLDHMAAPLMIAFLLIMLAGYEWWRYLYPRPTNPIWHTFFAVLAALYAIWKISTTLPILRSLKLACEGEKVVGQFLERLRENGYQIFHDVVGANFNLDHVVVGPGGVLTIETKTRSKPARGNAIVVFDGEKISVAGFEPDRDPVIQAKAQAAWLRALLAESTGRTFPVRPVIVFPGWFVERTTRGASDVWVLEPKALPAFLAQRERILPPEDVKLASFHLSRYVREKEKSLRAGR